MASLLDQVRQDAASLHAFVCSIADKCEHLNPAVIYPAAADRFFVYITDLATATKKYLQSALDDPSNGPAEYLNLREEIATLRVSWGFMHQFVKPVLDADTLKLPSCLLDGLKDRFCQIPNFDDTDFVFYHSHQLNYFNVKLGEFKSKAAKISNLVKGPDFSKGLGLIGIPYSQSSSFFVNCLVPHEMGHFIFGELQLSAKFRSDIENRLIKKFDKDLQARDRAQLVDAMAFWVEELFCDLFAVRLVGFCFSLAYVQLFDVATVLDEGGQFDKSRAVTQLFFSGYPPDLYRLKLQATVLSADGWWETLKLDAAASHYIQTLVVAHGLSDSEFIFPKINSNRGELKDVLNEIIPGIMSALNDATDKIPNGAALWKDKGESIERYLHHGTVPSTIVDDAGIDFPKAVAVLNASYRFYIISLPSLISKIEKADSTLTEHASVWAKRVEMWAAKAVEDVALLNHNGPLKLPGQRKEVVTDDSAARSYAVLSRNDIVDRLRLRIDNPESLVITPLDPEGFDQDSIDLRLGTHFLMPQVPPEPYVDLTHHERASQSYLHLQAPLGSYLVLPAHQTVLGATLEFVKLPYNVSGEILTKSSIARTFITIETAPWIHPYYRGCLTLEIANVSNTAIVLYPGTPIGQLVLFHAGITKPPEGLSGSYLGPIYPEAPAMKTPQQLFKKLGLNKYRRAGQGWSAL
jgi:dCTP deaminase